MKLLILGGTGFISRYTAEEAMRQGYEVYCVTRGMRSAVAGTKSIIADRNDIPQFRSALEAVHCRFDAVIDCICFHPEQAKTDLEILTDFTDRLIIVSTDSLYHPDHKKVPQDENGIYMDDNSYGGMKRKMELVFLEKAPAAIKWTLFRPPHMFGAGSELGCFPTHTRQKDLLAQLRAGKPIRLVGGGEYLIQPLYAGDIAKAMVASIHNPNAFNQIFCIAGPEAMPNRKYFETLGEILGIPVTIEAEDLREYCKTHDDGYLYFCHRAYDLRKLEAAGLPVPKVTLREGLAEQVAYLTAQGR